MRALAAVGFSNLTSEQHRVASVVPQLDSKLSAALSSVNLPGLPGGLAIYCYFERHPTGRVPVHLRAHAGTLIARLDIVAPDPDASADDMLVQMATLWSSMSDRVAHYLQRRKVAPRLVERVRTAVSLPVTRPRQEVPSDA
jgi:hypothetical protein